MNDGTLTLWICWGVWIYSTFLMEKKDRDRFFIAISSLLVIIFTKYQFSFFEITGNLSVLYLIGCCINKFRKETIINLILVFTHTILYCCIKIFYLLEPVVLIFSESILLIVFNLIFVKILYNNWQMQLYSLIFSFMIGELIFSYLVLTYINASTTVGLEQLDVLFCTIILKIIVLLFSKVTHEWKKIKKESTIRKEINF